MMRYWVVLGLTGCVLLAAASAWALTADEVIRLKKAGVSDAVIQKMLEQEQAGVNTEGPMQEKNGEVIYQAGENAPADMERNRRHEKWKEKQSMEALKGVIIDTRETPPRN